MRLRLIPTMCAFSHPRFARPLLPYCAYFGLVIMACGQVEPRTTVRPPADRVATTRAVPRRAIVEGLTEPVQNLRITDLNGNDISSQVQPRSDNGRVSLDMGQATAVVLKSKTIQTIAAPRQGKITLPGGAVVPRPAGTAVGDLDKAIWFRLTFGASPLPAPWDENENSYLTLLTFGLKRPDGAPPTLKLEQPVIVKLAYQGLIAPETALISLDAPGLENEKTIALRFTPQSPEPTLLVRSTISEVNLVLAALPRLTLQPERNRVLGLGLDVVAVTVTNIQPDGRSAPVERETPVAVTVEGGARIEPSPVVFPAGGATSRFNVRSSGLGAITIRANADGIAGATTVHQTFPTGPILAALIGGALGGFARRFVKGSRRVSNGRRLIEGIVVASIVFVAGVLGVGYLNLPAAVVATEAGAFLTGALGGFAGVSILEQLGKRKMASAKA